MNDKSTLTAKSWPDYRAVWRWHFYASLFCMPFVIFLAITGSIYLFKPQIERWNDRMFDSLVISGARAPVSDQVQAALAVHPDAVPSAYELPTKENNASRVLLQKDAQIIRVYVHPETLAILGEKPDDQGIIRFIRSLHGQLNLGPRGSYIVELAACWTMVMILTGLFLWWPRSAKGWGGVLYPRLWKGSKLFWRDIHSVTGIWISFMAIFLIATGLPWAKFWGSYYKTIKATVSVSAEKQDWTVGGSSTSDGHHASSPKATAGQGRSGGRRQRGVAEMPEDLTDFDRVVATVAPLNLAYPATVSPPKKGSNQWTVKSDSQNRTLRTTLIVDGKTGEILSHDGFADRPILDQLVSAGIAAHEGQLFGIANQLLGLFTAMGLVLLSVSGYIMWWRRREPGKLGAPKILAPPSISMGLIAIVVILAVYMPLFGASLIALVVIEKTLLSRIALIRDWLGLATRKTVSGYSQ